MARRGESGRYSNPRLQAAYRWKVKSTALQAISYPTAPTSIVLAVRKLVLDVEDAPLGRVFTVLAAAPRRFPCRIRSRGQVFKQDL
jgi:hypothetical protein